MRISITKLRSNENQVVIKRITQEILLKEKLYIITETDGKWNY